MSVYLGFLTAGRMDEKPRKKVSLEGHSLHERKRDGKGEGHNQEGLPGHEEKGKNSQVGIFSLGVCLGRGF